MFSYWLLVTSCMLFLWLFAEATNISNTAPSTPNTRQCGLTSKPNTKIPLSKPTQAEWPWIVGLGYRSSQKPNIEFKCDGTLVSDRHILTAAHCVHNTRDFQLTEARLGGIEVDPNAKDEPAPITARIKEVRYHPDYSFKPVKNDIAIVTLQDPVSFSKYIRPVCLLRGDTYKHDEYYTNKKPFYAGLSRSSIGPKITIQLFETTIYTVNHTRCAEKYFNQPSALIDQRVLCAHNYGRDDCQDNLGGTLLIPQLIEEEKVFYLAGIASFGIGCGNREYPSVFVKVSQYIDWIDQITGI